jgi:hypothetical protein
MKIKKNFSILLENTLKFPKNLEEEEVNVLIELKNLNKKKNKMKNKMKNKTKMLLNTFSKI